MFAAFELAAKSGTAINLATDSIKLAIVNNTIIPTSSTALPTWGTAGTTNLSANEVTAGTSYTAGGIALTTVTYTEAGGVNTFKAANVTIAQDATGFTTGYYGILYDATDVNKHCIGFVDLGGPVSVQGGPITISWNASGIFTETIA